MRRFLRDLLAGWWFYLVALSLTVLFMAAVCAWSTVCGRIG